MSRTFRLRTCETSALVLAAFLAQSVPGLAASCPTVADAKGLATAFPEQAEVEEATAPRARLRSRTRSSTPT